MDNLNSEFGHDNFQGVTDNDELAKSESKPQKSVNKHPLLTLQLVVALCALLFLYIIKFTGSTLFDTIMTRYQLEMDKSVIYNGNFEKSDYSTLFSTDDEV